MPQVFCKPEAYTLQTRIILIIVPNIRSVLTVNILTILRRNILEIYKKKECSHNTNGQCHHDKNTTGATRSDTHCQHNLVHTILIIAQGRF